MDSFAPHGTRVPGGAQRSPALARSWFSPGPVPRHRAIRDVEFCGGIAGPGSKENETVPAVVEEVSDLIHAQLGALAVDSWSFKEEFSLVIENHHKPGAIVDHRAVLANGLAAGEALAHSIEDGSSGEERVMDAALIELLNSVGIDEAQGPDLVATVHEGFEAFAKLV